MDDKEINDRALQADINIAKSNLELIKQNLELKDALEFESRVVEKLLQTPKNIGAGCPFGELCICEGDGVFLGCQGSRLKWARLAVEDEMAK